ncbi:hypothetical protein NE237_005485 [Protea cynaroides]|uniref:Uncharacterized protein n=1 Tax=Protea cynaroides TaxID=273540 RepID=A0A9Q0KKW6_9MAGN|nr:hypothetical protein NE237_005485 [Protea cynaroides]
MAKKKTEETVVTQIGGKSQEEVDEEAEEDLPWLQDKAMDLAEFTGSVTQDLARVACISACACWLWISFFLFFFHDLKPMERDKGLRKANKLPFGGETLSKLATPTNECPNSCEEDHGDGTAMVLGIDEDEIVVLGRSFLDWIFLEKKNC